MFEILHCPEEGKRPGILFFHGFTGDKVGGHRILVKTAWELAKMGFLCSSF